MLIVGNSLEVLAALDPESVDAVVTDAPYELGFMGKSWDASGIAYRVELWAACLRVLRPGGYLLAQGGARTAHRMTCAIEDAGFEIRDGIAWIYGQGFPKSLDVSKAIDAMLGADRPVVGYWTPTGTARQKLGGGHGAGMTTAADVDYQVDPAAGGRVPITAPATPEAAAWDGWGTALKPAIEPITVARKPLAGTVAANVLAHGVGAMNLAACRIGDEQRYNAAASDPTDRPTVAFGAIPNPGGYAGAPAVGRWPSNVIVDPAVAAALGDNADFFYCAKPSTAEREAGCEQLPRASAAELVDREAGSAGMASPRAGAGRTSSGRANVHPTVKPIDLYRYLCRLVCRPGGVVLDPFCGSGTTGIACEIEGFEFIGIDLDPAHVAIAEARIAFAAAGGWRVDPATDRVNMAKDRQSAILDLFHDFTR